MAIDERRRHQLHERLDDVLGPESAAILMSHLPPVGWADVATKHDLDHAVSMLRTEIAGASDALRAELHRELNRAVGGLRSEVASNHRQMIFAIIASQFTAVSLALAAFSLAQ